MSPTKGEIFALDDISFEILGISQKRTLQWFSPTKVFHVDYSKSLKTNIERKVNKYKSLDKALIVAFIPNFETFVDLETVANTLWGTEVYPLDSNDNLSVYRENDGLYNSNKPINSALSAIIWVPKQLGVILPMPKIGIFPNPKAYFQVSYENFKSNPDY